MPTLFPAHVNVLGTFSLAAFPAEFRPYIVSFYLFPLLLYVVRVTFWCVLAGSTNKQVLVDSENNASLIGYSPVRSLAVQARSLSSSPRGRGGSLRSKRTRILRGTRGSAQAPRARSTRQPAKMAAPSNRFCKSGNWNGTLYSTVRASEQRHTATVFPVSAKGEYVPANTECVDTVTLDSTR